MYMYCINIAEPAATCTYKILAGQSSSGKLGGREVKTSALISRRSWVRIPLESPSVKFYSHRHSESTEYVVWCGVVWCASQKSFNHILPFSQGSRPCHDATWEQAVWGYTIRGIQLFFCKYHVINHKGNFTGSKQTCVDLDVHVL